MPASQDGVSRKGQQAQDTEGVRGRLARQLRLIGWIAQAIRPQVEHGDFEHARRITQQILVQGRGLASSLLMAMPLISLT